MKKDRRRFAVWRETERGKAVGVSNAVVWEGGSADGRGCLGGQVDAERRMDAVAGGRWQVAWQVAGGGGGGGGETQ